MSRQALDWARATRTKGRDRELLLLLAKRECVGGVVRSNLPRLAEAAGWDSSTTGQSLANLRRLGLLSWTKTGPGRRSTRYVLHIESTEPSHATH